MGGKALKPFLARLKRMEGDWAIVRHALGEVGESGETCLANSCTDFLDHRNAHVRHSALSALFKLIRGQAEEELIKALSDNEAEVRQAAVSYLNAIGSQHPDALDFYTRVLNPETETDPDADGVLIETCQALTGVATSGQQAAKAQEILLAAIRPVRSKGVLGKLRKSAPRFGEHVVRAALQALGTIGTSEAIPHIEQAAAADQAFTSTAAAAIAQIKSRTPRSSP
jgi:HEAT repeat protein